MNIWQRISVREYLVCYESPEITRGKSLPHTVGLGNKNPTTFMQGQESQR